jgi:hypothetical protein
VAAARSVILCPLAGAVSLKGSRGISTLADESRLAQGALSWSHIARYLACYLLILSRRGGGC